MATENFRFTDTGIVQWDSFVDSIIFLHQVRVNTLKLCIFARLNHVYIVFVSLVLYGLGPFFGIDKMRR